MVFVLCVVRVHAHDRCYNRIAMGIKISINFFLKRAFWSPLAVVPVSLMVSIGNKIGGMSRGGGIEGSTTPRVSPDRIPVIGRIVRAGRFFDLCNKIPEKYENPVLAGSSAPVSVFKYSGTSCLRTRRALTEEPGAACFCSCGWSWRIASLLTQYYLKLIHND